LGKFPVFSLFPAIWRRDGFAADCVVSQAYRFFRECLRSRGKVRHLRGLGGGIRSLFRAELALRRFLARFRRPVSAAHLESPGGSRAAKPRPGSTRLETGSQLAPAVSVSCRAGKRLRSRCANGHRCLLCVCRRCQLIEAAQLMQSFCSCSAQLCGRARASDVTVRPACAVPFSIASTMPGDK